MAISGLTVELKLRDKDAGGGVLDEAGLRNRLKGPLGDKLDRVLDVYQLHSSEGLANRPLYRDHDRAVDVAKHDYYG